jgi:hypothetical protein
MSIENKAIGIHERSIMKAARIFLVLGLVNVCSAVCPTPTVSYGWPRGLPVTYSWMTYFGPSAFSEVGVNGIGAAQTIDSAFPSWTYSNTQENTSGVGFYWTGGTGQVNIMVVRVNYPGVPNLDPHRAAGYTMAQYSETGIVISQRITLYLGSLDYGGNPIYDEAASSFQPFVKKVMLHEIGHGMYLTDQPLFGSALCGLQTFGESVMNGSCGTNDSQNMLPTSVRPCDNQAIQ